MTYTLIAWALQPRKWTKGHQVLSSNLAWATIQWQRTGTSSVKTRCGLRVPLPAAGPLNGDLFTIVYYADEADRLGVCKRCQGKEVDPIKRVAEEARAKEARFVEEHDGMSSAEYFWESGYSDVQREREDEDYIADQRDTLNPGD